MTGSNPILFKNIHMTTKPKFSKKLLDKIESLLNKGIPIEPEIALLYAFCTEYNLVHRMYELGIFASMENEEVYRINFVNDCVEQNTSSERGTGNKRMFKCKYPLFEFENIENNYRAFYKTLVMEPLMKPYISKLDNTIEGKEAFDEIMLRYKEIDMNRFVSATIQYYMETEFSKKLSNYLKENAEALYLSYQERKSKLL